MSKFDQDNQNFEEYRRRMHPEEYNEEEGRPVVPTPNKILRTIFGIFMIVIFVGMGILMIINFFRWDESWTWVRWMLGVVFIIYGIFRAYRQISGKDYYSR